MSKENSPVTHIALHEHRFGRTFYFISSPHEPSEKEVIKSCGIDFEPDLEETLEIESSHTDEIFVIPARKPRKAKA